MIRLVWLTLLAVHTGVAVMWWAIMPGGFPSSATEYWVNEVAAPIAAVVFLVALLARGRFSEAILPPVLAIIPLFWMAFGISARILFPESFANLWNLPFILGAVLVGLWIRQFRFRLRALWLVPAVAALAAGWAFPGALQAPPPATTPAGAPIGDVPATVDHKLVKLSKDAQLHAADGRVVVKRGNVILNVLPMLSFTDRSPDRGWISLAPDGRSYATTRSLLAKAHDGAHWKLWFKDEDQSLVDVTTTRDGGLELEARSRLAHPIYSHLNTFTDLAVTGHKKLTVSFSPAPGRRVEAAPQTAAARFAYVDAGGVLHVVQASTLQRGPFTELASGPIGRDQPLVLTLYDADKPVFTVSFADWAAEASTQLSPTAGAGVPENAIMLQRGGDADTAPVLISFTLADTAIGRGTATVGHAAGVYRNRITIGLPPQ